MSGYVRSIDTYPASVELNPDYEDRAHFYQDRNYTYMPLIAKGKYYNVEEGWERDIQPEQYVDINTTLSDAIKLLQNYPFLLVDHKEHNSEYVMKEGKFIGKLSQRSSDSYVITRLKEHPGDFSDLERLAELERAKAAHVTYEGGESSVAKFQSSYGEGIDDELSGDRDKKSIILYLEDLEEDYIYQPRELIEESKELAEEIFDVDCSEKYGIVTLADVNKRPVKEMCYPVIADLANDLSEKLKEHYSDSEQLLNSVHPDTIGYWKKDRMNDLEIHITEYMNLVEMQEAIKASDKDFIQECGFPSKNQVQEQLGSINELRKRVMHANRTLVRDRKDLEKLETRIERAREIIEDLEDN